jgi:hypothetical protein
MYSVGGKIASVGNKVPEKRIKSISFTVDSGGFPLSNSTRGDPGSFFVASSKPIRMTIIKDNEVFNFGGPENSQNPTRISITSDGNLIGGSSQSSDHIYESVIFQNIEGEQSKITIQFEDIKSITVLYINRTNVYGDIDKNLLEMSSLRELSFARLNFVTSFPKNLRPLTELREITLVRLGNVVYDKMFDSLFDLNLTSFSAVGVFNLSDPISSNLFKLNTWENLEELGLSFCNIVNYFPDDWLVFKDSLKDLRMRGNTYSSFPSILSQFSELRFFYFQITNSETQEWFDLTLYTRLSFLWISGDVSISSIDTAWIPLVSLSQIINQRTWIGNQSDFDLFIEKFYILVTNQGFLDINSSDAINSGEPEQFRNIRWGSTREDYFSVLNPIQAPDGFSQGISNGTPANNAEKIYVLVENYGHTVELAP